MKKLSTSLPLKVTAIFLCIILGFAAVASGIGIFYMVDEGYYAPDLTGGPADFYETSSGRNMVRNYAYYAIELFREHVSFETESETQGTVAPGESVESDEGGALHVEPYTDTGLLDDNLMAYTIAWADDPESILVQQGTITDDAVSIMSGLHFFEDRPAVEVTCYMRAEPMAAGSYGGAYQIFRILYPMRGAMIAICATSLILALIAFVYLLCSVGRRRGSDGITLNALDRVPFDLYLLAAGFVVVLLTSFAFSWNYSSLRVVISVICLLVAFLIAFATVLTSATRFKAGGWWRNTIIWHVLRLIRRAWRVVWKGLKELALAIPIIWKVVLIFLAVAIINLFLGGSIATSHSGVWVFSVVLWLGFNLTLLAGLGFAALNMQKLKRAGGELAAGNLDYKIDRTGLVLDFKEHADNLERIGEGMQRAVEQRLQSERLKTELITNVSHDLRTPLTSIVNYVDLLSQQGLAGDAADYIGVLERQAKRLTKLTEDLVEASKASTGSLAVSFERTDLCELVGQSVGEYQERLEEAGLELVLTLPETPLCITADGRHLWRVMDNLLGNVCKYAQTGTRVYVDVREENGQAVIAVKNTSRDRLGIAADELMERFVRGDSARSTQGSGLGLNIARSLTELQRGTFTLMIDGDLFKCELRFWASEE